MHLKIAEYLKVPPWELAKVATFWRDKAFTLMAAEADAENWHSQHPGL